MPPASKKDCSVILLDVATGQQSKAVQTLLKIECYKYFTESKDLTKLILFNSDRTENRLNERHNGYEHIYEVAKDVSLYNPLNLMEVIEENSAIAEGNWLEGLLVALANLKEDYEHINGIITYQLLFITDLKTPLSQSDNKVINKIINGIKKLDAFLYVVGPDIEVPFTIKNNKSIEDWMNKLSVDESNQNLTILKKIITETDHSVVCDFKMGLHLFFSFKNRSGTQPWQVPLAIGSKVEIPAQTLKILDENIPCKITAAQGAIGNPLWVDAEDESVQFDATEVVSGIERHNKWVQMPDNKMFQVQNPRGFSVLCFTDSINVPEHIMRGGGCYCVLPNSTPEKNEALYILIDCLAKQNKYIIARRVYNNNFVPKITALIPKPDHNPKCFLLVHLPFAEDVRVNYKERKLESAPKIDPDTGIYNFLDSINTDDGSSTKKLPLGITMMQSSNIMKIINKSADKLMHKHMGLEDVDMNLLEITSGNASDAVRKIWPERIIEKTQKKEADDNDESDEDFNW